MELVERREEMTELKEGQLESFSSPSSFENQYLDSEFPISLLELDVSGFGLKLENVVCRERGRRGERGRGGEGQLREKKSSLSRST